MECPLCSHPKSHKHGKTSKGSQRYRCPNGRQTFTETFDTLYYRRKVREETVRIVLQSHAEGSSLRGVSRISGLAYNTGMSIIRAASQKAQMVHSAEVQTVETEVISGDEMWPFVKKTETLLTQRTRSRRLLAGLELSRNEWIDFKWPSGQAYR